MCESDSDSDSEMDDEWMRNAYLSLAGMSMDELETLEDALQKEIDAERANLLDTEEE